jgi:hypothetical protein
MMADTVVLELSIAIYGQPPRLYPSPSFVLLRLFVLLPRIPQE